LFSTIRRPPIFTLFPYTTLFRSHAIYEDGAIRDGDFGWRVCRLSALCGLRSCSSIRQCRVRASHCGSMDPGIGGYVLWGDIPFIQGGWLVGGAAEKYRRTARLQRLRAKAGVALLALAAWAFPASAQFDQEDIDPDAQMLLVADTLVYDQDQNTVTAVGGVQIEYDGNRLVAQRVTYHRDTSRVVASGHVEIIERDGNRILADQIDVTDDFSEGF